MRGGNWRVGEMAGELSGGIIKMAVDKLSALLPLPGATSSSSATPSADMEDLRRLERTMNRIQSLLLEAGDRNTRDCSEKHRLKELKEVAMDAEDLVEDYAYEVLHAKILTRNRMNGKRKGKLEVITDISSIVVSVPVPEEMAVRARMIRERFDEIVKEWDSLRWMESDGARRRGLDTTRRPPSSSLLLDPTVHGRCQDTENVIDILFKTDENSGNKRGCVSVLPIVGMGGVGKTTLAQLVYNDPRVSQHFDLKGWVCVSEEFDVKSLTESIIISLTKKPCGSTTSDLDYLQTTLLEKIKEKKFLIVLDDVWNESCSLWHSLRAPFLHSLSCKVIVTTRNEKVAKIMQTIPIYPLHCLNTENSWGLFTQVAFENQDLGEHGNLVEIGRKITTKCGGLPLAIKAIGCALHFEMDEEVWSEILVSDLWELEAGRNEVLPALQLSYDCMPTQLKQCFMFLSLFPKDYSLGKDTIVKLWASLGFLNSGSVKDIGNVYFDDLQHRSMIQKVENEEDTHIYIMHDLVHKLAEFVAGKFFARVEENSNLNLSTFSDKLIRYLTMVVNELPGNIDLIPNQQLNPLRFLQVLNTANKWMSKDITINFHNGYFENLSYLRAVDFSYTGITNLPDSIGNLKHLHYLGLSKTNIKCLPESICLLYNLQTLNLLDCSLQMLPRDIGNLVNLQHLNIAKWSPVSTPRGIGHLTNLVTLPAFNMDGSSSCEIFELENLNFLQGELCITGLGNVQNLTDVMLANLQNKKQINCLTLDWSLNEPQRNQSSSVLSFNVHSSGVSCESVLDVLKPHKNLQILEIYRYPGMWYPRWLGDDSYIKLAEIILFGNCDIGPVFLPSLGRLPSLRNLSIQCMLNVGSLGHAFCGCDGYNKGFRSLNMLEFKYMPKWLHWYGTEYGEFCSLNSLKITRCNKLRFLPHHLSISLSKLVLNDCKDLIKLPTLPSLTWLILMGQLNKYLFANLNFPSLKSLEIGFCQNIRAISLNHLFLNSLEVLVIKSCKQLECVTGLDHFTSLKELNFHGCPCLTISKNEIYPPSLKIINCPQLGEPITGDKSLEVDEPIDEAQDPPEFGDTSGEEEDMDGNVEKNEELRLEDYDQLEWLANFFDQRDEEDYERKWLMADNLAPQAVQEADKEKHPATSRKRGRPCGSVKKRQNSSNKGKEVAGYSSRNSSYKGKEVDGYSSGSSFGGNSESELGSFGSTSEGEFGS